MAGQSERSAETDVTVHAIARGRVQGVGFRWFVREAARRNQLAGWVRNVADGSVELAVSGPAALVEEFLGRVRRGPSGARVDALDVVPHEMDAALIQPFSIR